MTDRINQQLQEAAPEVNPEQSARSGEYATDAEIHCCAAFLGTDCFIYTGYGWKVYEANAYGDKTFDVNIYLLHDENVEHFSVITSV